MHKDLSGYLKTCPNDPRRALIAAVYYRGMAGEFTADDVRDALTAEGVDLEEKMSANSVGMIFRELVMDHILEKVGTQASRRPRSKGSVVFKYSLTERGVRAAGTMFAVEGINLSEKTQERPQGELF